VKLEVRVVILHCTVSCRLLYFGAFCVGVSFLWVCVEVTVSVWILLHSLRVVFSLFRLLQLAMLSLCNWTQRGLHGFPTWNLMRLDYCIFNCNIFPSTAAQHHLQYLGNLQTCTCSIFQPLLHYHYVTICLPLGKDESYILWNWWQFITGIAVSIPGIMWTIYTLFSHVISRHSTDLGSFSCLSLEYTSCRYTSCRYMFNRTYQRPYTIIKPRTV